MQFGVSECLKHWGKYRKDHIAVVANGEKYSYSYLDDLVDQIVLGIEANEVLGDRIAIALSSKLNYLVTLIATLRLGKSVVVLNPGLPDNVVGINISDARVKTLIYDDVNEGLCSNLESGVAVSYHINDLIKKGTILKKKDEFDLVDKRPNDEWGILFSSGSTGVPKPIERSHYSIVTELLGWVIELSLTQSTKFYVGRPLYYTGGLVLALSTLIVSGTIIIDDVEDIHETWMRFISATNNWKITWAFFIPEQIRAFMDSAQGGKKKIDSPKNILVMGSPISGEEKRQAQDTFKSTIVESWGNSESLGTITGPEDIDIRPGSIGRPFLSDVMSIVDEDGKPLQAFEKGLIAGSAEAGFSGYTNRPEETNYTLRNQMIISDDVGYFDDDGYFFIEGRSQDYILLSNGISISLLEIETKIREIKIIKECCLLSKGSEGTPVLIHAAIVLHDGHDLGADELMKEINKELSEPHQIHEISIFSEFPYLPSGKIDKQTIKDDLNQ
ncbi:class I adenylate-forming enzyme family protein [Candidatus Neomarinimicrobiota bacterium]